MRLSPRLPQLRQELTLTRGGNGPDGAPTWMLHDPAANRFFQLGWPAFELLSRWELDDPQAIVASVNAETTLKLTLDDVEALIRTLKGEHLLVPGSMADIGLLQQAAAAAKPSRAMWLLKHYLMIRIPVWRPMAFLQRFSRYADWAYRPIFWQVIAACALLGLYLVSRQWEAFAHTFHAYADWQGVAAVGVTLVLAKVLHEFGHAFTAYRYGCRVPTMGIALMVMVPMLYTDTTEAWRLPSRADRLRIGASGMLAELALAAVATLAWSLLPDGPLRAGAFLLATTTWISTLAINASPFMRFDGYFLLSDWLDMPNLHDRAFALGRWWLREALFGLGDPQPEPFPARRRRFLIAFAFATWLYRLTVFLSIALLVYHAFFKLLGMALFAVEFGWFIVRPVWREATVCWQRRADLRWHRQTVRSAAIAVLLIAWVALPWQRGVSVPAVFGAALSERVYAIHAGYLSNTFIALRPGQFVKSGQVLATLVSPELAYRLRAAQVQESILRWQVEQQPFDERLRQQGPALEKRLIAAQEAAAGLQQQVARLTIRAPFDGTLADLDDGLAAGGWVATGERLFDVVSPAGVKGNAYVDEVAVQGIRPGSHVTFVANIAGLASEHCEVAAVDRVNVSALDDLYVASNYGGAIPTEVRPGTQQIVPLQAVYRVRIAGCSDTGGMGREAVGVATIRGISHSLLMHGWRRLAAVLQSEAGF